jgi:hypothetical protein
MKSANICSIVYSATWDAACLPCTVKITNLATKQTSSIPATEPPGCVHEALRRGYWALTFKVG